MNMLEIKIDLGKEEAETEKDDGITSRVLGERERERI